MSRPAVAVSDQQAFFSDNTMKNLASVFVHDKFIVLGLEDEFVVVAMQFPLDAVSGTHLIVGRILGHFLTSVLAEFQSLPF